MIIRYGRKCLRSYLLPVRILIHLLIKIFSSLYNTTSIVLLILQDSFPTLCSHHHGQTMPWIIICFIKRFGGAPNNSADNSMSNRTTWLNQHSLKLHLPSCRQTHLAADDTHPHVEYHPLRSCIYLDNSDHDNNDCDDVYDL